MDGIDAAITSLSGSAHDANSSLNVDLSGTINSLSSSADAQRNAISSSLQTSISGNIANIDNLTTRVGDNESEITSIQNNDLGFARTGSNQFDGDQRISGSLQLGYTSSIANLLTLTPTDVSNIPPTAATGSFAVEAGSGALKYYDGSQWMTVVLA